jgi:hypothetical protein
MSENRRMKIQSNISERPPLSFVDRHGESILHCKLKTTELVWKLCCGRIAFDSWQEYQLTIMISSQKSKFQHTMGHVCDNSSRAIANPL